MIGCKGAPIDSSKQLARPGWDATAFSEALVELHLPAGANVTRGEEEQIPVGAGTTSGLPAWCLLLTLSGNLGTYSHATCCPARIIRSPGVRFLVNLSE